MSPAIKQLGEVCEIIAGQHIESALYSETEAGHPYLTGPADFGETRPIVTKWTKHPKVFAASGDVLVTVKGAGVGKINLGCDAAIGRQLMAVRPRIQQADQSYLFQVLRAAQHQLNGLAQGATVPGIGKDDLANLEAYIPPLAEQKRIAGILDAADALRAKRREALVQLDTLLEATFLDMFGDPVGSRWQMVTVNDVAQQAAGSIRTGPFGSQLLHSEFVDQGIRVLGIDNAVANEFRKGEPRHITAKKYEQLRRYTVKPGDVLITIMGTCGRCAIVPEDFGTAINTKHLCCITLDQSKCIPTFMHAYFLQHPMAKEYLSSNAKGAIMSGLNMGIIKQLPIPIPPLKLQQQFAEVVSSINRQKTVCRTHLLELDTLFASLQSRAFLGEL